MENVKEWLDKKGYQNSGLRIDRNSRIDLYLSDVLEEYRSELLHIKDTEVRREQLKAFLLWLDKDYEMGDSVDFIVSDYLKSL